MTKKTSSYQTSMKSAMSDAISALVSIGEECQEQYDNMPEGFQNASRGEAISDAAEVLGHFSEPDYTNELDKIISDREVSWIEDGRKNLSRAQRRDNAVLPIQAVVDACEELLAEEKLDDDEEVDDDLRGDITSFRDDLQTIIDDAEGVEFNG